MVPKSILDDVCLEIFGVGSRLEVERLGSELKAAGWRNVTLSMKFNSHISRAGGDVVATSPPVAPSPSAPGV